MAILKKRTSSRQLPEARGLDRAPLDSVIRNFNDRPSLDGRTSGSLTSQGSGSRPTLTTGTTTGGVTRPPVTSTVTGSTTKPTLSTAPKPTLPIKPPASLTTKPSLTPKTTLAPKVPLTTKPTLTSKTTTPKVTTPAVKPTVTTKTPTTPATKTTPTSVVKKPTVTPTKTNTNSTANKITNALTGAVLGAGTKLIYDKITGKPVVAPPSGGTKQPAGGTAKPPAGSTAKPPAGSTAKPNPPSKPNAPAKPSTSVVKPSTGGISATDVYKGTPADASLGLPEGAIDNGDGTYTVGNTTYSMENDSVLYTTDADGKITVADNAATDEEIRLAQEEGLGVGESIEYANGTTITALDNGNGGVMYVRGGYDTETGLGPKGGGTRGLGGTDTADAETTDTTVADTTYYQDDEGNYYTMNADGGYDLAYYADGSEYLMDGSDTTVADNTWTDPDTGAVWTMADNGEWDTDFNYDDYWSSQDTALADNTDYNIYNDASDYTDDTVYAGNDIDYGDIDYGAKGGLITMMKNGGVPHFEDGGEAYMPYGAIDNGDGTFTIDNEVFDMETGDPLYTMNDNGEIIYVEPSANSDYVDNEDGTYTMAGITYDMMTDMPLYADNAKGGVDLATDNGDGTYTIGNQTYDMTTNEPLYTTNPRTRALTVNPTAITSAGGGTRAPKVGNVLSEGWDTVKGIGNDALGAITGALGTTAGAAGAGALVATLLGQDFSGGTGAQNQGLDMSQVGLINPRTTDFGIGPTNFVGYEDYGTDAGDYTPNEELLRNLNAPGYNPVNEGDYGYEEAPAEEEVPEMSSGGLSSMSTPVSSYYTFGQPADIMANLGMRPQPPVNPPDMMPQIGQQKPPQQMQQQGMPQQMPPQMAQQAPQGMPQQGMMPQQQGMAPPMRKGGLPHVSNVPLVQGRMDFRNGSAVHGEGDGQSDDIPAMLADGEYVIDAETVAQIGNGSTKAGAQALDKFRESIRAHKRSAPINKIPPKTKALTSYLKGAK